MTTAEEKQEKLVHVVSRYSAILLPLLEAAIAGYCTAVVVVYICLDYLLHPSDDLRAHDVHPRKATGIAIIVVYFILLLIMTTTYLRFAQITWTNPGYIPLGRQEDESTLERYFDRHDAFVCDHQGHPKWCTKCNNFKPDRAHHCSEVGRCVKRMDHFCPWVGGIVSETNHKFFLQFLVYGNLYAVFTTAIVSVFSADRVKHTSRLPTTWIVCLALAGIFTLFALGILGTTIYHACRNLTTIEAIDAKYQVHHLAIRVPNPISGDPTFRLLQTNPGENPWDLGAMRNLKSLLGESFWEWVLPLKMSPLLKHDRPDGYYEWGPVVERLRRDAEGMSWSRDGEKRVKRERRRSSKASVPSRPKSVTKSPKTTDGSPSPASEVKTASNG